MKKIKRAVALLLALAMLPLASACAGEQKWSVKNGDKTLAIGVYIYYMFLNYQNAIYQVEDYTKPILDQTIEEQPAADYIQAQALTSCKNLLAVESKLKEMNVTLTEEELKKAQETTDAAWAQYKKTYEGLGISKDSYHEAATLASLKYNKLFQAIYGKEGTQAVSDGDVEDYFLDNYTHYAYFYKALTKTDDDNQTVNMTDDEKEKVKEQFEEYLAMIEEGKSIETVAKQYETDDELESSPLKEDTAVLDNSGMNEELLKAIKDLGNEKAVVKEIGSYCYLVYKFDINDQVPELKEENKRNNVLTAMKSDEFKKMVEEVVGGLSIQTNDGAFKKYNAYMFES